VLMMWFPFSVPLASLQCLSDALLATSETRDLRFRKSQVICTTNERRVGDKGQLR
jgi:hypothetical protein